MTFHSALYRGHVMHARHDELARRAFQYSAYMAALDLDELPALDRTLRLFSHRRWNLFSFDERAYASTLSPARRSENTLRASLAPDCAPSSLRDSLAGLRAANGLAAPHATRLVTNLAVVGYVFNPVSFFIDYDATGAITGVIAEVNNTYGGALRYVLGPRERVGRGEHGGRIGRGAGGGGQRIARDGGDQRIGPGGGDQRIGPGGGGQHIGRDGGDARIGGGDEPGRDEGAGRVGFRHIRELFVSPFLHGELVYDFWFDAPLDGQRIDVEMFVTRAEAPGTRVLTARFGGARVPMTDRSLARAAVRYPLMTAQVIGLIHLEALKLRWRGVPYRRPGADHRPLSERM